MLLLHEPAAGLGAAETAELGRLLRRLTDEWGMAILLVEHDVSLVFEVCDRVSVLDFGKLIAEGQPATIASRRGRGGCLPRTDEHRQLSASQRREHRTEPLLSASGLIVGYGNVPAVSDVDIEVHRGEVLAILGANGAGKTTTILALAGELRPMAGEVRWDGSTTDLPLYRRAAEGTATGTCGSAANATMISSRSASDR